MPEPDNTSRVTSLKSLPGLLRLVGAGTLIASMSIFLLQGWDQGNDVYRYLLLLGHSVGLAVIGFASGHWLRESKGARLFVMLALTAIPVNFTILGAFLFSQWSFFGTSVAYPSFATWQVDSLTTAVTTIAGSLLLLGPVIWLGFRVIAGAASTRLALIYLMANATLLLPVRDSLALSIILIVSTLVMLVQITRAVRSNYALKTPEGVIARTLPFLPMAIIMGRGVWFYAADQVLITAMSLVAFLVLRYIARQRDSHSRLNKFIEAGAVISAAATAVGTATLVAVNMFAEAAWFLPICGMVFAALMIELSRHTQTGGPRLRRLATGVLSLAFLGNLVFSPGVMTAAACLFVGIAVLCYGYMREQRFILILGALTLLTGLGYELSLAIDTFNFGSWTSLATLGVIAILAGSVIERHGGKLKSQAGQWRKRLGAWEN
jgi:hypothetical protein